MTNITKNEDYNHEFKSCWRDNNLKVITAFANSEGGVLSVGIDDDGKVIGVEKTDKLLEDIPNKIKSRLGIIPSVRLQEMENKDVIEIHVKPSIYPVSYKGRYYIRTGSTVQEISGTELTGFLLSRSSNSWDTLPSDAGTDEIDTQVWDRFTKLSKNRLPEISKTDDTEKILKNLDLMIGEKLSNAAVLLFTKKPQRHIINAGARVGRFKTDTDILDTVEAFGNLFKQLETLLTGIRKHLSVRFEIKGVERNDIWDYPLEALREGVINALIHRDYLSTADIQIKVYDDKIKIWNPGKLPPGISVEDLKKEHGSIPRNKLLAYSFYYAGLIEKWGSGTERIVELCNAHGLPEPDFKEESGGLSLYFFKDIYRKEHLVKAGLSERQIEAVLYVKEHGKITNREYQKINEISRQTASRDLKEMVDLNILLKHGKTGRDVHYTLAGITADKNNASQTPQTSNERPTNASEVGEIGDKGATKGSQRSRNR